MVTGDQWPIFVYAGYTYDPEDPWNGLFRSPLLVCVNAHQTSTIYSAHLSYNRDINTSLPLQVLSRKNQRLRVQGMRAFTGWRAQQPHPLRMSLPRWVITWSIHTLSKPSQVRFALSSSPVFSRTDTATDSETFYTSILQFLDDSEEKSEVDELMIWWNR